VTKEGEEYPMENEFVTEIDILESKQGYIISGTFKTTNLDIQEFESVKFTTNLFFNNLDNSLLRNIQRNETSIQFGPRFKSDLAADFLLVSN